MIPYNIPVPASAASSLLAAYAVRVTWFSFRETSGAAPATIRLRNGSNATGGIVLTLQMVAGASPFAWCGHHGLSFQGALFLEVVAGTVEGGLQVVPEEQWGDIGLPVFLVNTINVNTGA